MLPHETRKAQHLAEGLRWKQTNCAFIRSWLHETCSAAFVISVTENDRTYQMRSLFSPQTSNMQINDHAHVALMQVHSDVKNPFADLFAD